MAYVDWLLRGRRLNSCSRAYGCPCEFNALPTYGHCEGMEAMEINEGYFGDVRLDGLRFAARYHWPGPVHEGHGVAQGIIDARATEEQRTALFKILNGEEQEPTTVFNIYGSTIEREIDTVFAEIDFAFDYASRTGRLHIADVMEATLAPIRNPVTGQPHRAMIRLPEGFGFHEAEMASGNIRSSGGIEFAHADCYGSLWYVAYGPYGIIDEKSVAP